MTNLDDKDSRAGRLERIRTMVHEDHERINNATNPYLVFNLDPRASQQELETRFQHYERFYRLENFQRLKDEQLIQQAFEIRKAIERAKSDIQAAGSGSVGSNGLQGEQMHMDPDQIALADIYYRDGLTYLHLADYDAASDMLRKSLEYDATRGIVLAHQAYTNFKLYPPNQETLDDVHAMMNEACLLEPDNPEIYMLLARFAYHANRRELVCHAIEQIEAIQPDYPKLNKLKQYVAYEPPK